jgi:protein-S-isoprenylcysteine O-methyltransferase Ste14
MQASAIEFRFRFWVIALIFWIGFSLSRLDHERAAQALAQRLGRLDGWPVELNIRLIFWLAAVVMITAAAVRTWATSYLCTEVMIDTTFRTERLVADGPYRFVRNPLYLGTALLSLALAVFASRTGAVVIVILMPLFLLRLINREEAELKAAQGESYGGYLATVPRLVPALTPRLPASGAKPRWAQALLGETFMWGFAVALTGFAITLSVRFFYYALALSFLGYAITRSIAIWKKKGGAALASNSGP